MSDPYLGQIIAVGFSFAPPGWFPCDGRTLSINQYTALYSLLGTTYGGNGTTTFALPDLRGRTAVGIGQGQGTSNYQLGQQVGAENVTLSIAQMPAHSHALVGDASDGSAISPAGGNIAQTNDGNGNDFSSFTTGAPSSPATLNSSSVGNTGGGQALSVIQPTLAIMYIIAVQGIYPTRP